MNTVFVHSVKVPRLYKNAAQIVKTFKEGGSSLKQLVYEKKHPNVKALYAIVVETLRNFDTLNSIILHSEILKKENRLDPWLTRVLITELLWGKRTLPGGSKPVKTILLYKDKFLNYTLKTEIKPKIEKVVRPTYVRVNTLILPFLEAINNFCYEGWSLVSCADGCDYAAFLSFAASLGDTQFMVDIHVKDLLLFPPGSEFFGHRYLKNGSIILQDKSSCLPPLLLNPPVGAIVLDMCSAPGLNCIQVASMVGRTGTVFAVEKDKRRYEVLRHFLTASNATNVKGININVLNLTDSVKNTIEYILVDPSCSSTGMLNRVECNEELKCSEDNLKKLAGFQLSILLHALNNFSSAKRIVYSTCSVYTQENEEVVKQAITSTPEFKLVPLNENLKDKWYNFGSKEYGKIGESCLCAKPDMDRTNGFFIAVFERLKKGEFNEHFADTYLDNEYMGLENFI